MEPGQRKSKSATLHVIDRIESVRWFEDFVELRFAEGFDGTTFFYFTRGEENVDEVFYHQGKDRECFWHLDMMGCTSIGWRDERLRCAPLRDLRKEYVEAHGPPGWGYDWFRFACLPEAAGIELFGYDLDLPDDRDFTRRAFRRMEGERQER